MRCREWASVSLCAAVCLGSALTGFPVQAKSWTVEERQARLMQDINAGQKSGGLTLEEANELRSSLSDVSREKAKMNIKSDRKLTAEDISKLESSINKVSSSIHKLKLEKRLLAPK